MVRRWLLGLGGLVALAIGCGRAERDGGGGSGGTSDVSAGSAADGQTAAGGTSVLCGDDAVHEVPFETGAAAGVTDCEGPLRELPFLAGSRLQLRQLIDEEGVKIPLPLDLALFDAQSGTSCGLGRDSEGNIDCLPGQRFLEVCSPNAPAPSTTAVRFTEESPDPTLDLAPQVVVGRDGSRVATAAFFERERQVNLQLIPALELELVGKDGLVASDRLLPARITRSLNQYHRGPGCDGPPLLRIDGCELRDDTKFVTTASVQLDATHERPVNVARTFRTEYSPETTAYYRVGEAPVLTSTVMDVLVPTELPLDTWPQAEKLQLGSGRFRYDAWRVGCFTFRMNDWLYDTERDDARCNVSNASDGVSRCLPLDDVGSIVYADSACTRAVVVGSGAAPKYAFRGSELDTSPRAVFAVGEAFLDHSTVYELANECRRIQNPNPIKYELLDEVPPETFGALRVEVVP